MSVEAQEYLDQISKNESIIKNKQAERAFWLGLATNTTASLGGDRVQSSGNKQQMESRAVEVVRVDEEISRLRAEIADIISTIQRLNADDYDFLHKHYVQHKSLKEIHCEAHRSYSWATTTHSRAKKRLQAILDSKEKAGG